MNTYNSVIQWLSVPNNPSVRYRTLKELLGYDERDLEVVHARAALLQSEPVQHLLEEMHPDGYWLQKNPRTKRLVGDGVEYGSFGTTHFCLAYLAELGLDRHHPQVAKAAERYLDLQQVDGDWLQHFSCLIGYNIRTMVLLGFRNDEHVQRAIDLLLRTCREDGGYLCDMHEGKYKTKSVKSCIRGSVKALMAFSELPEYWGHPRCKQLLDYFLRRGGIFKAAHTNQLVNKDMGRLTFPVTWRANIWEVLYALSKMGHGNDARLSGAWDALENRATNNGLYQLDWTPTQCPWKVGEPGEENKWITFYVMLAKHYAGRDKN